jgi:hypothetical protein
VLLVKINLLDGSSWGQGVFIKSGVYWHMGEDWGNSASKRQQYQHGIRLNCGYPWSYQIEQSLAVLGHLAGQQI